MIDCINLLPLTGQTAVNPAACGGCGGLPSAPLYGCKIRGETTGDKHVHGYTTCLKCSDRPSATPLQRIPTEPYSHFGPGLPDPLPTPANDPKDWTWPTKFKVQDLHLAKLREVARMDFGKPTWTDEFGVVYLGEDNKDGQYGFQTAVAIHTARKLANYHGPIEWWWNPARGTINPKLVEGLGHIRIRSVLDLEPRARIYSGWSDKSLIMLHSAFRYVFRMDADAYFVGSPMPLINAMRAGEFSFGYWVESSRVVWERVWPAGPGLVPPPQSGQIPVDRLGAWPILCTSAWIDAHRDYYYADESQHRLAQTHQHGDQVSLHLAILALTEARRQPSYTIFGKPGYERPDIQNYRLRNEIIMLHRVGDKISTAWQPKPNVYREDEIAQIVKELRPT